MYPKVQKLDVLGYIDSAYCTVCMIVYVTPYLTDAYLQSRIVHSVVLDEQAMIVFPEHVEFNLHLCQKMIAKSNELHNGSGAFCSHDETGPKREASRLIHVVLRVCKNVAHVSNKGIGQEELYRSCRC